MPDRAIKILLFDGVCNLCNASVLFVIKRDAKKQIRYAAIQSTSGKKLMKKYGIEPGYLGSLIFIDQEKVYFSSTGALRLCKYLKGLWPLLYGLIIVPPFIRNTFYNLIAKYRYTIFGKKESCMVPTTELKSLFLEHENEV
jgi:predicted DCC family thiol-disulfide oxidoreductase YuxK